MAALWLQRACLLMALSALVAGTELQKLCGAELVDTIQFVCGERRALPVGRAVGLSRTEKKRVWNNLYDECCLRECSLEVVEQFCKTV